MTMAAATRNSSPKQRASRSIAAPDNLRRSTLRHHRPERDVGLRADHEWMRFSRFPVLQPGQPVGRGVEDRVVLSLTSTCIRSRFRVDTTSWKPMCTIRPTGRSCAMACACLPRRRIATGGGHRRGPFACRRGGGGRPNSSNSWNQPIPTSASWACSGTRKAAASPTPWRSSPRRCGGRFPRSSPSC